MRAAVYEATGPAGEVLRVVDVPHPEPAPGEVRVRVEVSGVNPTDWKRRTGASMHPSRLDEPQIPNQDGAGVIDAVGPGVDEDRIGERVWVYHAAYGRPTGTAAEYTCVPAYQAVPLPDTVSSSQGAGLGIPYITAHHCLFADGSVAGRTVLVTGGAGAVGNAAIQLARWAGARVVATVSSEEKARIAAAYGAGEVVNYREEDVPVRLADAAPDGVDRVVDVALTENLTSYAEALRPRASVAAYATAGEPSLPSPPVRALMVRNVLVRFVLVYTLTQPELDRAVEDITAALQDGALAPLPEHRFPLDRIAAAHEAVEQGAVGKVLVDIP